MSRLLPRTPLIVAHRGDVRSAPESTLAAFDSAIVSGADAIEFDVHFTRDGELVVCHDYYLGRTVDASGYIGDYTLAELRALDAGSWFDARFAGERMPTLSEVLDLGKGRLRFEIEMRTPNVPFLRRLIDVVSEFGVADDVELTSPHTPLLLHVKRVKPGFRTGMFIEPFPDWMPPALGQQHVIDWMTLADAQVAHLPPALMGGRLVERLHENGFLAHGADLNTEAEMRKAVELHVDQFSTDELDLALSVRG